MLPTLPLFSLFSLRYVSFLVALAGLTGLTAGCDLADSPAGAAAKRPPIDAGYHPPGATSPEKGSIASAPTDAPARKEPWTEKQLMPLASMAAQIQGYLPPVTFDIGSAGTIRMARKIGPVQDEANLAKFRKALKGIPKDQPVVVYCGCCPFETCPNIRPAFELLKAEGFTRPRLLNLPNNLKVDWIDQGYPIEVTPDQYNGTSPAARAAAAARMAAPSPARSQSPK